MKNINEITPSHYHSFYLSPYPAPFDVKIMTSLGLIDSPNYELIDNDGQIIIGYKDEQMGYHDNVIIKDGKANNIQLCTYENISDILNEDQNSYSNFFVFMNSAIVPRAKNSDISINPDHTANGKELVRCDYDNYGVAPFYPNKTVPQNILKIRSVLDISGVAHVLFVNTTDGEKRISDPQVMNTVSRTFTGIIKTIHEWSIVNQEPFNNIENVSIKAKDFIDRLNIDSDIINEIIANQPDMKVARYLLGHTEDNYIVAENDYLPTNFLNWYKSKIRYRTLNSLVKNNPIGISIDNSILEKEKKDLESIIYSFCIINNIDYTNISITDLLHLMNENKNNNIYQNLSESIDSVQKYIYV